MKDEKHKSANPQHTLRVFSIIMCVFGDIEQIADEHKYQIIELASTTESTFSF